MSAREAWQQCGEPNGDGGIQNIRKRARLAKASFADGALDTATLRSGHQSPPAQEAAPVSSAGASGRKKEMFRLRSDQVLKSAVESARVKEEFDRLYAEATKEWATTVASGESTRQNGGAAAVAAKYAAQLPANCTRKITARSLYNAVAEGRFGIPVRKSGPARAVADCLVKAELLSTASCSKSQETNRSPARSSRRCSLQLWVRCTRGG